MPPIIAQSRFAFSLARDPHHLHNPAKIISQNNQLSTHGEWLCIFHSWWLHPFPFGLCAGMGERTVGGLAMRPWVCFAVPPLFFWLLLGGFIFWRGPLGCLAAHKGRVGVGELRPTCKFVTPKSFLLRSPMASQSRPANSLCPLLHTDRCICTHKHTHAVFLCSSQIVH